ncbi:alpha-ribazole phosphatase [Xenorhabdus vietnamensis]|uniref:Alpha-ribazole phosphatase n=1 Tax=Xenorhabdus vietnamensis TaxID=351656 RepID=A0A1Y2S8C0_9GAMM|nr:adenosylcobalamin/alpha-ribazole phosphatase [Xenorhabdus vietnamensis]OTA14903.1 alpha-ribazole phosphatase [Xenorhabdus vietnamensis]
MRLFLVRHGQTQANIDGVFCGKTDLPLTEIGVQQGQQVAVALKNITFQSIRCSEMQRAQQTAQIISQSDISNGSNITESNITGSNIISDQRLNELNFGGWELRHHENIANEEPQAWSRWLSDWQNGCPTGGEPFRHFSARVEEYIEELCSATALANHLIVAHQGVLGVMIAKLLKLPITAMWSFPFQQGAYSIVDIHAEFTILRVFNARTEFWLEQ